MILYLVFAFTAGILFAVQGPTNTSLGKRIGPLEATMVSFGGGTALLAILVLLFGNGNLMLAGGAEPWKLLGGVYGAFAVFVSVITIPVLGLALSLMLTMLGQLVMGAVIDQFGLLEASPVNVSFLRILGIVIVAAGIVCIYRAGRKTRSSEQNFSGRRLWMAGFAVLSGIGGAVQAATNSALSAITGSLEGTLVSFIGGFLVISILALIRQRGKLSGLRGKKICPWMVIGGIYGATAIFLNIISTGKLGIALLVVCGTLGQLTGGVAVDSFGWFQTKKERISILRITGIFLVAFGAVIVSISRMRA